MPGNDLPNLLSAISTALTLAVILFAWQTVQEAKKTTAEERKTVTKLEAVVQAQQVTINELKILVEEATQTTAHAATSAEAAQRTLEVAARAQEADRRHRQLEQLRAIGRLVIVIRTEAEKELASAALADRLAGIQSRPWRCMEQSQLRSELVGVDPPLPKCAELVGANQAAEVKGCADQAHAELQEVFRSLGVGG